jgi:autophagy-related protein 18
MYRLIVVLQDKTFIYDLSSSQILEEIDTVHNPKGKHPT